MFASKLLAFILLFIGIVQAIPLNERNEASSAGLEAQSSKGKTLVCKTDGKKKSISEDYAKKLYKKAPSGKDVKTKSGFPHIFNNRENIKWDNNACNSKKVKTLEFPIFEGTNPPMFEWKEKKPSKEPGACRVVYSETDSHYCGVMCHESQKSSKPEDRKFAKCT